jgi:hypothetical protein
MMQPVYLLGPGFQPPILARQLHLVEHFLGLQTSKQGLNSALLLFLERYIFCTLLIFEDLSVENSLYILFKGGTESVL